MGDEESPESIQEEGDEVLPQQRNDAGLPNECTITANVDKRKREE